MDNMMKEISKLEKGLKEVKSNINELNKKFILNDLI